MKQSYQYLNTGFVVGAPKGLGGGLWEGEIDCEVTGVEKE